MRALDLCASGRGRMLTTGVYVIGFSYPVVPQGKERFHHEATKNTKVRQGTLCGFVFFVASW